MSRIRATLTLLLAIASLALVATCASTCRRGVTEFERGIRLDGGGR